MPEKYHFFGYRNVVGHLIFEDRKNGTDHLTPNVQRWVNENLRGAVTVHYLPFYKPDDLNEYRRFEFCFEFEEDIPLFKLFHIHGT